MQGSCENTYQVNELPEYVIKENPELIPLPSKCPRNAAERKYFEITRTRNLNSCARRSNFHFFKPGRMNILTNDDSNGGAMSSRMSVTRFIVCASIAPTSSGASGATGGMAKALRASNLVLQKVINENEQNENMMRFNTERFMTGTKQILMLRKVETAQNFPSVSQPMKLFDLMYEYDTKVASFQGSNGGNSNGMGSELESGRLSKGANGLEGNILAKASPKASLSGLSGGQSSGLSMGEVTLQIKKLLKEVTKNIMQSEKSGMTEEANKSNINLELLSIARGFSMVDRAQTIKQLWEEVDRASPSEHYRQILKNYFIDTVAMAGTPASVEFIVEMIEENKLTRYQIVNYLMWMPHYIMYPTTPTLEKLYRAIRSEKIQSNTISRNVAITSFTQLLQQACMSGDRKWSYPTFVTGEFCNANSRIVKNEWIPYILGELAAARTSNDRNIFLVALGTLQHRTVIRELIPYVSGSLAQQVGHKVTELNRLMATYSLANIGHAQPNVVVPILMTVFSNPAETTEMRIAAFNCMLRMNPSTAVFSRIAAVTQQEPSMDLELLKTINIAFYTLANEVPTTGLEATNVELINKARLTFRLIKRVQGITPTSGTIYKADFMKQLGLGYEAFIAFVASETSILPRSMYTEVTHLLDQWSVSPLRMGYRVTGLDKLFGKAGETVLKELTGSGSDASESSSQGNEWAKIKQLVGGMNGQVKDSKLDAAFIMQLWENGALFLSKEQVSAESLAQKIMPYLKNPELLKKKLGGAMNLNVQRTFDLAQMAVLAPSDMGFPINMEYHTPMTFSLTGEITSTLGAAQPRLDMSGKFLFTAQYIAQVGTVVPFSKNLLITGVNQHTVINIPAKLEFEMNVASQKLSVMFKPHPSVSTPVDMVHFHRYPFTVSQKITDLTPISEQPKMKQIRSPARLQTVEKEFGDYLGLKMTSKLETESRFADVASVFDILRMYKNCPLNLANFAWTLPALSEKLSPSVRMHRVSIIYDPRQSSTKEIGFEIRVGCATKKSGESSGKYHTLKVKTSSGISSSSSKPGEWSEVMEKLSPYSLVEKTMESSPVHPRREQKLKQMLDEVEASTSATGVTLHMTGLIKGSRPRTWTSVLSILGGAKTEAYGSMKQNWDIRLEKPSGSPNSPKHLCAKGTLKLPLLPIWNTQALHVKPIDFVFQNKISMGMNSCNEASIMTSGSASVSEEQKEFSKQSPAYKKCQKMTQQGALAAESSTACKTANTQARTLDRIQLTNQFTSVPEVVKTWEQRLATIAKAYLWPYIRNIQASNNAVSANTFTTSMKLEFGHACCAGRAFDLTVKRPQETLSFNNVRIPYPLSLFAHMKAGFNNRHQSFGASTPAMQCNFDSRSVRKFDGSVLPFKADGCFHLLAADHKTKSFAVEVKKATEDRHHAIKVLVQGIEILLTFDGQPKVVIKQSGSSKTIPIPLNHGIIELNGQLRIMRYGGDVLLSVHNMIGQSLMDLVANEHKLDLLVSPKFNNQLIGLCGASNSNIKSGESKGIKSCKFTKPSLEVASSRIQTVSCPQLEQSIKEELEKEKMQCKASKVNLKSSFIIVV